MFHGIDAGALSNIALDSWLAESSQLPPSNGRNGWTSWICQEKWESEYTDIWIQHLVIKYGFDWGLERRTDEAAGVWKIAPEREK